MKTKKGFMLRSVVDTHIVVPIGQASVDFNGLITLNETGAFLWEHLAEGCSYDELLNALLSEYDVAEDEARKGIDSFLETARNAGVIEE
jgi:hypothetical protein